jgi:hypothetical protein
MAISGSGAVRGENPRGYPGVPTNVPLDAMTVSCSTQVCAEIVDEQASSQKSDRPEGSADVGFMIKPLCVRGCEESNVCCDSPASSNSVESVEVVDRKVCKKVLEE